MVFFIFIQINLFKQTVENLIRRRVLRHLIWFRTVCRCPTKRTLGLYGLNPDRSLYSDIVAFAFEAIEVL